MSRTRAALLAATFATCSLLPTLSTAQDAAGPAGAAAPASTPAAAGGTIAAVEVQGNQRIEEGTIRSYILVQPGDPFDPDRLDRSLKALYATGLFADVDLRRVGSNLVVRVAENPIVNRIAFEGNHKINDDALRPELLLRPRSVFTVKMAQADRQRILDLYARRGRFAATVEPKIVKLEQNRVDVVFEIHEGAETLISRIAVVGNKEFSEGRLKEVVGSREEAWWRFLSSADDYDPDRVNFDKELLRRFYFKHGYADFEVQNATAELAPDRSAFFLTFTVSEGERYKVGKVTLNSTLKHLDSAALQPVLDIQAGDWYDGDAVERNIQALTDAVHNRGFAFVDVKPRISRDKTKHTIDLVFDVGEGPRVYVERIDIVGNTRTEDKVIRREMQLAEGDAFNAALLRRSRQHLQDLNFFTNVQVNQQPGSAPDKVVVNTAIEEKATGELTLGGGYSSDIGALVNTGLHEHNFIGSGIDGGINAIVAQKETSVDLSVTDPYFLDRNIAAGFDLFHIDNNNQQISQYSERRSGVTIRAGYAFNEHLRQSWAYSLIQRDVYGVDSTASLYIKDLAGQSVLSQIGQTVTVDYRDSTLNPHTGWLVRAGTDFAGAGGTERFIRSKIDTVYYLPLDGLTGNADWGIAVSAGVGYLFTMGQTEKIIDNFFLGGDNLRGFLDGGAGPHAVNGGDSLGGKFIWTQSTELRFPLPLSPDLGLTGRVFVDMGGLSQDGQRSSLGPVTDSMAPRLSAGVGVSWQTPLGLINIDLGDPILKQRLDQTQIFRFGFGTRF